MSKDQSSAPVGIQAIFLPGLHGDDALITELVECLESSYSGFYKTTVHYPTDIKQSYKKIFHWLEIRYDFRLPTIILAESFSTVLALKLADAYPESVKAVIIAGGFCNSPKPAFLGLLPLRPLFMLPLPKMVVKYFLIGNGATSEQATYVRKVLKKLPSSIITQRIRSVLTLEEETIPSIPNTPVLLLHAQDDMLIPWDIQNQLENHLPHAESHWIDSAHFLFYGQPELCAEYITEFLEELALLD